MKNVLIIVLPYLMVPDETRIGYWSHKHERKTSPSTLIKSWPALPYGVLSLVTYNKDVANIKVIDCNVDEGSPQTIVREMIAFKPDIVGFAMTFDNAYLHLRGILEIVRGIDPNVITVIGGAPMVAAYQEILDEQEGIDAVCYGDGEIPFRLLCEIKDSEEALSVFMDSPSWVTRYSLAIGRIPCKTVVENLDDILELDYSFIDIKNYLIRGEFSPLDETEIGKERFPIITSRGCPFRCSFCYRSRENDRKMHYASVDKVIAYVKYLVDTYGMNYLSFYDDQFLFNKKRAKEIFRLLEPFHLRVELQQGASVAFIDEEMAYLMSKAGVKRIVMSIESGSQYVLDKMVDKPVDLDRTKDVVKYLRKYGIWATAAFVMGFPGETDEHREETLQWIKEAGLDWSSFSAAVPIRGTKLYDMCVEGGFIKPDIKLGELDVSNYFIHTPGHPPEYVTRQIYKMNLKCNFVENYAMQQGNYDTAAKSFLWIINHVNKDHAFAHHYLYKCLVEMGTGMLRETLIHKEAYGRIIAQDPKWAEYARDFGIGG